MNSLIVATSDTPADLTPLVARGLTHRVDYVELAAKLGTRYLDYGSLEVNPIARRLENRLRLDVQQALHARRVVSRQGFSSVFSMSERVAIPLGLVLDGSVRHVVLAHHLLSSCKLLLMNIFRLACKWNTIIVPTSVEAVHIRRRLQTEDGVMMMYNPVDTRFYRPLDRTPGNRDAEYVLSVGMAGRDYPTLIAAMRSLPHIPCKLGANSLWLGSAEGAASGAFPPNVSAEPYVPADQLRERYARSRFVVVPLQKRSTHLSAGTTTVEVAQAMGKVVIVTRNPGITDYVLDGETGILVDGGDPAALAEAIDHLWNDPELATRLGNRAREWAEAHYSLDHWLETMSDFLTSP